MMTFYLPIMFMMCFPIELHSNEHFTGWTLEQPTKITIAADQHDIYISEIYIFNGCPFNAAIAFGDESKNWLENK